jgi:predicted TIM-barrel fold metal-dependent hydrolase
MTRLICGRGLSEDQTLPGTTGHRHDSDAESPRAATNGALSRRDLLAQGAALGLLGWTGLRDTQAAAATPHRIDVHHHFLPPQYLKETPPAGYIQRTFGWSPEKTLEEMDQNGVAVSMLSFPTPSLWFPGIEPGRRLARLCNDYCADVIRQHPGRFGMFAGVPPFEDTEGCLREIEYAYDSLKADGIAAMTNYSGHYLGDESFAPVWEDLNRRKAVVFVHPANPQCCMAVNDGVGVGYGEWPFDTARTVMSLWTAQAVAKWPNIRFIFSHGGGGLPMIADRIDKFGRPGANGAPAIHDALAFIQHLYFDIANAASPPALAATRAMADPSHVLFGTDYPYIPTRRGVDYLAQAGLSQKELQAIERGNALALLPRLQGGTG